MVGSYVLKDNRRLGQARLTVIDTSVVDDLYDKLLIVRETDASGQIVERERRTSVNNAMKSCRRLERRPPTASAQGADTQSVREDGP
jgi:hypothetical protein